MDSGPSSSKEACERSVRGGWATEWFVSLVAVCTCGPHAFAAVHFPLFFLVSYPVLGEAQWSTPIHLPTPPRRPLQSPALHAPPPLLPPAKGRPPLQFPSSKLQADRGSLRWIQHPRRRIDLISNQIELPNGASSALAPIFLLAFSSFGVAFDKEAEPRTASNGSRGSMPPRPAAGRPGHVGAGPAGAALRAGELCITFDGRRGARGMLPPLALASPSSA